MYKFLIYTYLISCLDDLGGDGLPFLPPSARLCISNICFNSIHLYLYRIKHHIEKEHNPTSTNWYFENLKKRNILVFDDFSHPAGAQLANSVGGGRRPPSRGGRGGGEAPPFLKGV